MDVGEGLIVAGISRRVGRDEGARFCDTDIHHPPKSVSPAMYHTSYPAAISYVCSIIIKRT